MVSRVVIPARFNGPATSGNGGYSCGVLGTLIGDRAEITLRLPPPLDREMSVETEGASGVERWKLLDGESVVAEGRIAEPDVQVPEPPTVEAARAAEAAFPWRSAHPFPRCFVCGPERTDGDGLRLFTGKVDGRDIVASAWNPAASFGTESGTVDPTVVWSALDCPSYFGACVNASEPIALLGRLTAKLVAPVRVGAPHVVIGWPIGREGRKWTGGSAVFTAEGELCAFGKGLWVELKQ